MAKRTHKDIVKEKLVATGLDLEKDIRVIQEVLEDLDPVRLKDKQNTKDIMKKYGDSLRPFTEKITIDVSVNFMDLVSDGKFMEGNSLTSDDSLVFDIGKLENDVNYSLSLSEKVKEKMKLLKKAISEIKKLDLNSDILWDLTEEK
jgi:hypothetical protein